MKINDIRIVQGETIDLKVTIKDEQGNIVNIEGFEAIFGSSVTGYKSMLVVDNILILTLSSEETLLMPPKEYRYEIKVKTTESKTKSVLQGNLIISKGYVQFEM